MTQFSYGRLRLHVAVDARRQKAAIWVKYPVCCSQHRVSLLRKVFFHFCSRLSFDKVAYRSFERYVRGFEEKKKDLHAVCACNKNWFKVHEKLQVFDGLTYSATASYLIIRHFEQRTFSWFLSWKLYWNLFLEPITQIFRDEIFRTQDFWHMGSSWSK